MVTWAHPTAHVKRHLGRANRLFGAHGPLSLYFTMGWPLPHLKTAPSLGNPEPHTWLLGPIAPHMPNGISIGPAVLQDTSPLQKHTHTTLPVSSNRPHLYAIRCGLKTTYPYQLMAKFQTSLDVWQSTCFPYIDSNMLSQFQC